MAPVAAIGLGSGRIAIFPAGKPPVAAGKLGLVLVRLPRLWQRARLLFSISDGSFAPASADTYYVALGTHRRFQLEV